MRKFTSNKSMKTWTRSIGKWNNIGMIRLFNMKVGNVTRWGTTTYTTYRHMQKNYKLQKPKQQTNVRFLNFQKEINKLINIVTKLKIQKILLCILQVVRIWSFKVENVLLNLHCEALGLETSELVEWWEEVQNMFKENLQQVLNNKYELMCSSIRIRFWHIKLLLSTSNAFH
jgi:hypothetical protein